jgi:hypothetical protein
MKGWPKLFSVAAALVVWWIPFQGKAEAAMRSKPAVHTKAAPNVKKRAQSAQDHEVAASLDRARNFGLFGYMRCMEKETGLSVADQFTTMHLESRVNNVNLTQTEDLTYKKYFLLHGDRMAALAEAGDAENGIEANPTLAMEIRELMSLASTKAGVRAPFQKKSFLARTIDKSILSTRAKPLCNLYISAKYTVDGAAAVLQAAKQPIPRYAALRLPYWLGPDIGVRIVRNRSKPLTETLRDMPKLLQAIKSVHKIDPSISGDELLEILNQRYGSVHDTCTRLLAEEGQALRPRLLKTQSVSARAYLTLAHRG